MPAGSAVGRSFIELAAEQSLVDLLGEQPFAPELAQGLVLDAVARGGDDAQGNIARCKVMGRNQAAPHVLGLPERERASSCSDQKRAVRQANSLKIVLPLGGERGRGRRGCINGPIRLPLQSARFDL
jgi:hypothetical protein